MEAGTAQASDPQAKDPRHQAAVAAAGGDKNREMVEHVAQGAKLDHREEAMALEYLLGAPEPMEHEVEVDFETPNGMSKLTFVLKQVDARKLDEVEQRHVNRTSGQADILGANVEIVALATRVIRDRSGREVALRSEEFLTVPRPGAEPFKHASPVNALEERFRQQLGLMSGVASEVRRVAGFSADRVGQAQRRLVKASLD